MKDKIIYNLYIYNLYVFVVGIRRANIVFPFPQCFFV